VSTAHMGSSGGCPRCGWLKGHFRGCASWYPTGQKIEPGAPRREPGPWMAWGCTLNELGWTCLGHDFIFDNDEQCGALDACGRTR
jgi:hypothetical protein